MVRRDPADNKDWPDDLGPLIHLHDESTGLAEALGRIHYPELTTVYPPVSQLVFALAVGLTPRCAYLPARVTIMKGVLLGFDLATVALVLWLLRASGKHLGWGIAYAWCPLVMKEFANSGHLDSIAVCLTMASICCMVRFYPRPQSGRPLRWGAAAGALLGLAVARNCMRSSSCH